MNYGTGQPINILLVEDNPGEAELTIEAMRQAKVSNRIHVVEDGVEAIEFLYQRSAFCAAPRPDLILLDLNLPRMDGREVLAQIKSDPKLKRIPVIVLSSSCAQADINSVYDLHASGYLAKPIDMGAFIRAIQSIHEFWFCMVTLPEE